MEYDFFLRIFSLIRYKLQIKNTGTVLGATDYRERLHFLLNERNGTVVDQFSDNAAIFRFASIFPIVFSNLGKNQFLLMLNFHHWVLAINMTFL